MAPAENGRIDGDRTGGARFMRISLERRPRTKSANRLDERRRRFCGFRLGGARATPRESSNCELPNQDRVSRMTSADQSIPTLTKSQADCLLVLRNPGRSQSNIAIAAKLDLKRAETALRKLEELGLARQTDSKLWIATALGEDCSFETVPEQRRRRGRPPASERADRAGFRRCTPRRRRKEAGRSAPAPAPARLVGPADARAGARAGIGVLSRESATIAPQSPRAGTRLLRRPGSSVLADQTRRRRDPHPVPRGRNARSRRSRGNT